MGKGNNTSGAQANAIIKSKSITSSSGPLRIDGIDDK